MKRRRSNIVEVSPWLSANPDSKEKRFIQPGNSLLLSKRFQQLSIGARYLYLCMALECAGRKEFIFPQKSAKKFGFSPTSFWRYKSELEEHQFIKVCSNKNLRIANDYEFDFSWKTLPPPPTK